MKVGVIGAGIFGVSIALKLSREGHEVLLLEKEKEIMTKASAKNHFRHHYGYHYPRSKSTALESIYGKESFEKEYGDCVLPYFPTYYSIVNKENGTLTTPAQFLTFCEEMGLPYKIVQTPELINREKVAMTVEVPERAFDPHKLKEICQYRLKNSQVDLRLNSEIVGGAVYSEKKKVTVREKIEGNVREYNENLECIINATYANMNKVKNLFNVPVDKRLYELLELIKVKIPGELFGAMNMDGEFTSLLPMGRDGFYTVAHVRESVLKSRISDAFDDRLESFGAFKSNKDKIMEAAIDDFPILRNAEILESIYITKSVVANADETDERPSEIFDHGNNVYSVFAGKVITSMDIANKLLRIINSRSKEKGL